MKDKKRYEIIYATCIVSRKGGIKEQKTFSFLYDITQLIDFDLELCYDTKLKNAIEYYNEFCPEDFIIIKYEFAKFEKVGEIWF